MRGKRGRGKRDTPNTLGVENITRTDYLLGRIGEAYYANKRIGQQVTLGGARREEMALASPAETLKILVNAKYLFVEMAGLELRGREVGELTKVEAKYVEIMDEVEAAGCGDLAEVFRHDLETMRRMVELRSKFGAHPIFSFKGAMEQIGQDGFGKFWQCARRLLLLKDAVEATSRGIASPVRAAHGGPNAPGLPHRLPTGEELEGVTGEHEGPGLEVEWPEDCPLPVMRDCATCIQALLDEFCISFRLHRESPSAASRERLCNTVYSLKYAVLEMHDFIVRYGTLELAPRPKFLGRADKYKWFRDHYAAHNDKCLLVVSLVQLLDDPRIMPMLILDMHEALCVSRRLFERIEPSEQIMLPTSEEIARMDGEIETVRKRLRDQLGERFANGDHRRQRAEFRAYIRDRCGLG